MSRSPINEDARCDWQRMSDIGHKAKAIRRITIRRFRRFRTRFLEPLRHIGRIGQGINFAVALICLVTIILYQGFHNTLTGLQMMLKVLHVCQIVFVINIVYNLIMLFADTKKSNQPIKWTMDALVVVTMIPLIWGHAWTGTVPLVGGVITSHVFFFGVLTVYSLLELSYGLIKAVGKRTNPSLLLSASFLFFIVIGSFLLMLPRCTVNESMNYVDALFVSTSAVCITGLSTVDVAEVFTPFGLLVLSILLQTGALGVMTFTSFFALFFSGNTSIYSQLMVKDMVYSKTANALLPTLLYIFIFTIVLELVGAVGIFLSLPDDFPLVTLQDRLIFSGFQSLSAFCNAGFVWVEGGLGTPSLMSSNQMIYIVTTLLVFAGGIGFPTLVNFKDILRSYFHRLTDRITGRREMSRRVHIYDVNTKVVLAASGVIVAVTVAIFLAIEWDNTLRGMSLWQKFAQAFFNSSVPRSSGFSSVNPANFLPLTLLLMMVLMWIGGASQSTAGGIKVNTFALMLLNLWSVILGKKYVTAFDRTIAPGSVRRANAVIGISLLSLWLYVGVMLWLEPALPVKAVLFETVSALFTVGSSLGITAELSTASKIVICTAMFVGRVGIISLLAVLGNGARSDARIYPYDNIIIS